LCLIIADAISLILLFHMVPHPLPRVVYLLTEGKV
ncbi:MAG: hypothetical protein RI997_717, partial [Pseudomonadota bacterium]